MNDNQDIKNNIVESAKFFKKQSEELRKKYKKKRTLDDYIFLLKFYYLPVIVIIIFILILIFGVFPSFKVIQRDLNNLDKANREYNLRVSKLESLKTLKLNSSKIDNYLDFINKIAPVKQTNVANFQDTIFDIAKKDNLQIARAEGGEEIVVTKDEDNVLQLIEIPIRFNISGNFFDLKRFLDDIYKEQDNFIIIKEMDFSKPENDNVNDWKLKVTLIKYQFVQPDDEQSLVQFYSKVPIESRPNEDVLNFISEKYNIQETLYN